MTSLLSSLPAATGILWNPNPEIFNIAGISVRYYGVFWCIALILALLVVRYLYKDKKIEDKKFEPIFFYCFFGVVIGARLGHCLFYEPEIFIDSPLEALFPIKITDSGWKFSGYTGLSSHGGIIGMLIALWMYVKKTKMNYMDVLDMIAIAAPIAACWIRLANLMNSEIIGIETNVPWAFIFAGNKAAGMVPRHPAQLYEAIAYLILFVIMIILYKKYGKKVHRGFFFGVCLVYIFVFRFFVEFIKDNQVEFEEAMTFNMGQWLSVPLVLIGLWALLAGKKLDRQYPAIKR